MDTSELIDTLAAFEAATAASRTEGHIVFFWLNTYCLEWGWYCYGCVDHPDELDSGEAYWPTEQGDQTPSEAILRHAGLMPPGR